MRILAAELIDGENISPRLATPLHQILDQEIHQGVSITARILVGNSTTLNAWSDVALARRFQFRTHRGGKNAADYLLQEEAFQLAQQGITRFYVVSNDSDFVTLAGALHMWSCQVIGLGTSLASKRWQDACTLFLHLEKDVNVAARKLATLNQQARTVPLFSGGSMNSFTSPDASFTPHEKTQEALKLLYGSANQPPLLTKILFLFLEHSLSALCLSETDQNPINFCSHSNNAAIFTDATHDPIILFILDQDPILKKNWESIQAFACRCKDAYDQGKKAAQRAFSHFPHQQFHALHQEHLSQLLLIWRYNPHAAPAEAKKTYPDYTPEGEQAILRRWFRQGYLAGSMEEVKDPQTETGFTKGRRNL